MTTGKKASHDAGKLLHSKGTPAKMKTVAASDLAQSKHHSKHSSKGNRSRPKSSDAPDVHFRDAQGTAQAPGANAPIEGKCNAVPILPNENAGVFIFQDACLGDALHWYVSKWIRDDRTG
jgi:hypothetical protein